MLGQYRFVRFACEAQYSSVLLLLEIGCDGAIGLVAISSLPYLPQASYYRRISEQPLQITRTTHNLSINARTSYRLYFIVLNLLLYHPCPVHWKRTLICIVPGVLRWLMVYVQSDVS